MSKSGVLVRGGCVLLIVALGGAAMLLVRGRVRAAWGSVPRVRIAVTDPLFGAREERRLASTVELVRGERLRVDASSDVAARCAFLAGWPGGANECLVLFPCGHPKGYRTTTLGAWAASLYYETTQGGILYFSPAGLEGRSVLMLDRRWCSPLAAYRGLEVDCSQESARDPGAVGGG